MKTFFLSVVFLCASFSISAQQLDAIFKSTNTFLSTYVKNGRVDYKAISKNPTVLNSLLDQAAQVNVLISEPENYKAFWINAYNLAVIKGLVNNYPTKSPLDDKGFFDKTTYKLAGQELSLNGIENDLLRAKFNDARFHFVLVCGALGCPPLISEAYIPGTLEAQLTQQTQKAINGNFIKVSKNKVEVSEIMKWYKADFTQNGQTEIDFINAYRNTRISKQLKLSYFPYNWNINAL